MAIIDQAKEDPDLDLFDCFATALAARQHNPMAIVREMVALRFGPGRLSLREYFYYRLHEERLDMSEKRRFVGRNVQEWLIRRCCSDLRWWGIAHDKILFYFFLRGLGMRTPEIYAFCHKFRTVGMVPTVPIGALPDHLRKSMRYPFFAKPVDGMYSVGVSAVNAFDAATDHLVLWNGERASVEDYVREIAAFEDRGYLFQERLHPHPDLQRICGDRVSTARVMLLIQEGPQLLRTLWKIPLASNIADNFWRPGNLLAEIDRSGRVVQVVQGVGPSQRRIEHHPVSGHSLIGLQLPDWDRLIALCMQCAAAFSGLKLQAWDIAMCPEGPVVMELNIGGDFNLPQLATGHGMLDYRFKEFLATL
jgi:hypothetical protein